MDRKNLQNLVDLDGIGETQIQSINNFFQMKLTLELLKI